MSGFHGPVRGLPEDVVEALLVAVMPAALPAGLQQRMHAKVLERARGGRRQLAVAPADAADMRCAHDCDGT